MKHLKLFEAFESSVIGETISFLSKKIGKYKANEFKDRLRFLEKEFNIPIDKINNSDIIYTNKIKGVKITTDKPIENDVDIYCLKYWFSIENGFLGQTAVVNNRFLRKSDNYIYDDNDEVASLNSKTDELTDFELDYIKTNLGLKTGTLKSAKLSEVKNGDKVVVILNEDPYPNHFCKGEIFIDDNTDGIFVLQNNKSGSTPSSSWRDKGYEYSWKLGTARRKADDNCKLHIYKEGNELLESEDDRASEKAFHNNVLLGDYNIRFTEWNDYNKSVIRTADFCIVVYLDRLLGLKDTKTIKDERVESRKGATALMRDSDIKKINLKRYTSQLFTKLGVTKESIDFSNINNMLNNLLIGDYSYWFIYNNENAVYLINSFADRIYELIESRDDYKQYYYDQLVNFYDNVKNGSNEVYRKAFIMNTAAVGESGNNQLINLFNKMFETGKLISEYIKNNKFENIDDILMLYYKLDSIQKFKDNNNVRIEDYTIRNSFIDFDSRGFKSRITSYSYESDLNDAYETTIVRLDKQAKYVKSILK